VARTPGTTASATTEPPDDAQASPTAVAAPASTPTASAPAPAAQLTVVAASVRFLQSSLTAPVGLVTITFDNRDEGISHNLHVFSGSDAFGAEIGSTEIRAGAVQQTLALGELAAGTYFYQCDVHPSRMMGTLTVSQ
jgi:plastocyanin